MGYKVFDSAKTNPTDALICPAIGIFDLGAVQAELPKLKGTAADVRPEVVRILSAARKNGLAAIKTAFEAAPLQARAAVKSYSYLTDCLVVSAFQAVCANNKQPQMQDLAVIAVGGCGRGEMALHSDVDLLFLSAQKISPWAENVIESVLYILWDLRLKLGHASRTMDDCMQMAKSDYTIRTSLVEMRHLCGDEDLSTKLQYKLQNELFISTAADFIEAKLDERSARHQKQGGQRYMVEPNVKEGKGGLRDLQSLFWIGKYVNGVTHAAELVDLGVFSTEEFDRFAEAEDFLWAVRCNLHIIAGRAMDQLTFDLQVEVAARMGYEGKDGRRGVEWFMQDYFRHATVVGELTRVFLTAMEAAHLKAAPKLMNALRRKPKLRAGYEIRQNRLLMKDTAIFLSDGLNILRLFEEGLRTGGLLHPDAMRLISANLHIIDGSCRNSPEAQRIFCDLLLEHGNPERSLRRMNELGVLAAFIPEFEPIVALMQFNMYHSYTVDEHTIQTISHLARIERGELLEELPIASHILETGIDRKVLYIALLLHDIGKGRAEDHSILGARFARKVAPRLGLDKGECETVEWLVRYHLLMSDMAQKRDVADPRTVRLFAKAVKTVERLDLLTVLTVCDISGVGPGVWNNWKAVLIRALYRQTRNALENGLEDLNRENRGVEAKQNLRTALSHWPDDEFQAETRRHYDPYWQGLHVTAHMIFAQLLHGLKDDEIKFDIQPDLDRDATRACFAMTDHPGIFSRITGALALVGANIVDARTFTTKDSYDCSIYWIQNAEGHPYVEYRLTRLRDMITKTLNGEVIAKEAMKSKDKLKKREKPFTVPTSITFDNEGSEIYTIIEVDTRDRPGLLYDLTRTLAAANVNIASAVIATYGEQAVDVFYVKDMFGLKYHTKPKQQVLEEKLRKAIERGADWANS